MENDRRREMKEKLEALDRNQKRMLFKRAQKLRRGAAMRKTSEKEEKWDGDAEAPSVERNARRRRDSIQDWALHLLGQEGAQTETDGAEAAEPGRPALVVSVGPGRCGVDIDGEAVDARVDLPEPLAPGDEVRVAPRGDGWAVVEVRPRRTRLSRPDPMLAHVERVIAANVDIVVVVASAREPYLRPRLLDRFLIAAQFGGARAIVAVTKADLVPLEAREEVENTLAPLREAGTVIVLVSTTTGEGLPELRTLLAGSLATFVGQSGVGKSSLVSALDPSVQIKVNAVQARSGKGKHTTTGSTLHSLAGNLRIIDTPGVRSFGMWEIGAGELAAYFPEFAGAERCRFSDCQHDHEPGCGVKEAVAVGSVSARRYESYLKLLRETS